MQYQPQYKFIKLHSGLVHFHEAGQGTPMVLLHANPGDSRNFDAVFSALAVHHRVIALDWPGYGQSAMPEHPETCNPGFFGRVLSEFVVALDLPPAVFVGDSLGGNAAAMLAIEQPARVRALVLVSPGGFTEHNLTIRFFCRIQGSRLALSPLRWASLYLRVRIACVQSMLERAASLQATPQLRLLNRSVWRSFVQPAYDLRESAKRIQAPTLLVFGRDDLATPAKKDGHNAKNSIPHSDFTILPCSHVAFAEMPEQFLLQVQAFLLPLKAG